METHSIPLKKTGSLPRSVADLQDDLEQLHPFRAFPQGSEGYEQAIEAREMSKAARKKLAENLLAQYANDDATPKAKAKENIEALEGTTTYTVTTGHQLCLFTGPLLFIHKTLHTISIAKALEEQHPDKRFVPVHWMASEDHDRNEIDHIVIDGETLRWRTDQEGAVGRMKPEGLEKLIPELQRYTDGLPHGAEWISLLETSYKGSESWAQATRKLLNALFGEKGLVVIDGDDAELKKGFKADLKKEFTEKRSARCIERTDAALEKAGYSLQVHPREMNLFYLLDDYRERIEAMNDGYRTADGKYAWGSQEALEEVEAHPERFSPNVVLRPLYQERLLPNVAYVGGPAEVAYWHQLKGLFDEAGAFFPLIQLRSQVFHIDRKSVELMERSGMGTKELFRPRNEVIRERVKANSRSDLDLESEEAELERFYKALADKAASIDPNLWDSTMAEHRKAQKGLDRLRKKMLRDTKKHERTLVERIERSYERLFPEGTAQERVENITPFYAREGDRFLHRIEECMNPLHAEALMIVEKEA